MHSFHVFAEDSSDPPLTADQLAALATLELSDEDVVRAHVQDEVQAYHDAMANWWHTERRRRNEVAPSVGHEACAEVGDGAVGGDGDEPSSDDSTMVAETERTEERVGQPSSGATAGSTSKPCRKKKTHSHPPQHGKKKLSTGAAAKPVPSVKRTSAAVAPPVIVRTDAEQRYHTHSRPARRDHSHLRGSGVNLPPPCSLHDIVRAVLPPEERVGGPDVIADGLSQVKIAELQDMNLTDSSHLEMLGSLTHLYAQHNALTELFGLQLCPHVTVVVVHHNKLTSLEDSVAELPNVVVLDVSFNQIAELDAPRQLPVGSLRSLNMLGNPCCPAYDAHDPDDVRYVDEYRRTILAACEHLTMLDNVPVTKEMRRALGLEDGAAAVENLLAEMARNDEETLHVEAELEKETGLQAAVCDEDFLLGNNAAAVGVGVDDEPYRREEKVDDDRLGAATDDEDSTHEEARGRRPPRSQRSNPKRGDNDNVEDRGAAPREHLSIADRLLSQYTRHTAHHMELVQEAVMHSSALVASGAREGEDVRRGRSSVMEGGQFDPEQKDVEDDDDVTRGGGDAQQQSRALNRLADVTQEQVRLRGELRMAMHHHSQVAQMKLTDHWHEATGALRERQHASLTRRLEMKERLSRPSAAYASALEVLSKEATVRDGAQTDLQRYRTDSEVFSQRLQEEFKQRQNQLHAQVVQRQESAQQVEG